MSDFSTRDGHDNLEGLFAHSRVPAPSANLTARVVTAAMAEPRPQGANDRRLIVWSAVAGLAATLVAGILFFANQPNEAELWAAQADAAGFGDLYEWVGAGTQ
ncbi:hypothetical protein [uncultured Algimonas sp.]|uniref:hypothetical protein n=1 Tax=uncultured Algimonas sp. TaxID=1547920 RepID=UPI0026045F70|nr:hypothetical protein [uncultured Algimonas sp.]